MRKYIPTFFKPLLRIISYKNERRKIVQEISIRKNQNKLFEEKKFKEAKKLIVFLVEGADWFTGHDKISGGILSIASLYEETLKLEAIHKSEVLMVTLPQENLLLTHTQFPNKIQVLRFNQLRKIKNLESVLFHIPEYRVSPELAQDINSTFPYLKSSSIHLNILNQRIDIMPLPTVIEEIKNLGFNITQTTAHEQYTTLEVRKEYDIPLHKFSVYATPERYAYRSYREKEDLILVSPDLGKNKKEILADLRTILPRFKVKIIKDLSYSEYLSLVEKAKFTITFGEGLDFYFIETVFSGGISFAVYNKNFFTPLFENLPGTFSSYNEMSDLIVNTILEYDNDTTYRDVNSQQFSACHQLYNGEDYKNNLINFYKKNYLLP